MPSYGRVQGLKIELEIDGSKVTRYLSTAAREVGKVQTSLKDLEKSLKLNPTSTELLTQKQRLLGEQISKTRDYLAQLKNEYSRLSSTSNPTQKQIEQMDKLAREISDTEVALRGLYRAFDSFSVAGEKVKAVGQSIKEFGSQMQSIGSSLTSTGMAIERLTAPIQAAFGYGIKETMTFEQSMANVQAVTMSTQEDFEKLEKAAIDMSKTTVYSADETAQALYYMGLAGWDADQSIGALPGVLDLAAAGQVDLARASSIVVDGMNAMGIEVTEYTDGIANASHFTNVMAAAMSNSNTTVDLLGESFKYAAPLAGSLGFSIDDLTLGLGLMASSGIKGSQAGTGLRMALKNLAAPTEKQAALMEKFSISMDDGYGNALPLREIINQFRTSFGGLNLELVDAEGNLKSGEQLMEEYGESLPATQMEKFAAIAEIVGVRALPGVLGMVNATDEAYNKLAGAIDTADGSFVRMHGEVMPLTEAIDLFGQAAVDAEGEVLGVSEAMREIQLSTAQGQITLLKDNFSALAIELGKEVIPYIVDFVNWLSSLVDKFRELDPETQKTILVVAGIAAAIGPVLIGVGQLMYGLGGLVTMFGTIVSGIGSVISIGGTLIKGILAFVPKIFAFLAANPVVLIIAAIAAAVALLITYWDEIKEAATKVKDWVVEKWNELKEKVVEVAQAVKDWVVEKWNALKDAVVETFTALGDFCVELWNFLKDSLVQAAQDVKDKVSEAWTKLKTWVTDTFNSLKEKVITAWNNLKTSVVTTAENIKNSVVDFWTKLKDKVTELVTNLKEKLSNLWENIKTTVSTKVESIKNSVSSAWENIKSKISGVVESIKSKISGVWESIKSITSSVWNSIKTLITNPIESAKRTVEGVINKIKGLFPLSIGNIFKNFKMPHLSWSWKDVGGILKIPSFHVDWYAKAMKNGMLLDGATIFGMNSNGQPMGGGEVGREWIVGENGLMSMIRGAVSQSSLNTDAIAAAVLAGMEAANVEVYMDSQKVTREVTKQITNNQAGRLRYYGAY